mgnify:CR=1 FL=1
MYIWKKDSDEQKINYEQLEKDFKETYMLILGAKLCLNGDYYKERGVWISFWEQYKTLQRFAFKLDNENIKISQYFATYLTEKYNNLMLDAECEKQIDLSGDYLLDFDCWVLGKENTPKCW